MSLRAAFFGLNQVPPPPPPFAPSVLTAVPAGANRDDVLLTWDDNSNNETGFEVQYSTDNSTWSTLTTTAADVETYTHTTPTLGEVTHYYRVRAVGGTGNSAWATAQITGLLLPLDNHWTFDEAISSGSRADSIGLATLTDVGSNKGYTTGKIGNAVRFLSSGWLENNGDITNVETFSVTQWVYFPGDTSGGFFTLRNPSNAMPVRSVRESGNWVVDKFLADLTVTGLTHGVWHLLYVGYDMPTQTLYASIDAGAQVSNTHASRPSAPFTARIMFGVADGLSNSTFDNDDPQFRRRLLSQAEIAALYNAGSGLAYPFQ